MTRFATRVKRLLAEQEAVRKQLPNESARLVTALCNGRSLRQLARMAGLSHAYLSRVRSKKHPLSPDAFVVLSELK